MLARSTAAAPSLSCSSCAAAAAAPAVAAAIRVLSSDTPTIRPVATCVASAAVKLNGSRRRQNLSSASGSKTLPQVQYDPSPLAVGLGPYLPASVSPSPLSARLPIHQYLQTGITQQVILSSRG